jgi:Leucine-rich repeat (LRR) protein
MAIDGLVGHTGLMKPALLLFALALGAGCGSEKDAPPPKPKPPPPEGSNESRQHLFEKDNLDHQVIEQTVRRAIEKPEGDLTEADLWRVTGLDFTSQNLTDLGPLAGLTRLQHLYLSSNRITELKPLAGLVKMKKLYLSVNPINNPSPLAGLKELVVVNLADNPITRAQAGQLQKALPKCEVKHNLQP